MKIDVYIGDIKGLINNSAKQKEYLDDLSDYRRKKAEKLKSENGKALSLGVGYLLKTALGDYGLNEKELEYGFSENGKPYLLDYPEICFNLSHSHSRVMCAISKDIKLGCDVELVRSGKEKVAKRFFTEYENKKISEAADEEERARRFFEIWTLKESFIKCTGEGIARPMDGFEFRKRNGIYKVYIAEEKSESNDEKTIENVNSSKYGRKYALDKNYKFASFDNADGLDSDENGERYLYALCYEAKNEKNIVNFAKCFL